jgi:hypothetical protein
MKDDYLWDRRGQPDQEIQQLEEILSELRYQPRQLEIPAELKIGGNRFYSSRYAIAAAVAMIVFGVGAWMAIQKQSTQVVVTPEKSNPAPVMTVTPESPKQTVAVVPIEEKRVTTPRTVRVKPRRSRTTTTPQLSSEEMAEAVAAKDRLMMALRLASSKLNYAQKKTQGSSPAPVYHQHKIG